MPATAKISVPAFGVEADGPRNNDLLIQSIPGCRVRSAINASKGTVVNRQDRENSPVIPKGQATFLGGLPPIPGMQIHVNPAQGKVKIVDPLHGDDAFCKRLEKSLAAAGTVIKELSGVPPREDTLDEHRMKTLCRELLAMMDAGEAKLIKGPKPDIEDIDEMPGRYLLNPGSQVPTGQPRFEDQLEEYVENLRKVGG